ncbi:mannuronate-specific alginate lyase [Solimonas marina]|uniref:Mannuronate-specific alginate lyase n=1 Tax=Solimonas marina TaxID=2714601 RepID=A0A970B6A4_9GAMM|nr:mannuronate-specific alginate lyase [Solimonas marina]NKF22430.1 mannuronate-specific alginate lyase [Solimonas marina]
MAITERARRTALAVGLGLVVVTAPALADQLVPPTGYYAAVGHNGKTSNCPSPPKPFTGELDFPSKYTGSGKARDQLNEQADARYKAMTQPIRQMEKGATKLVDQYMESGSPEALACVLQWYGSWADAGALLGPYGDHTGKSMRKWALASLSSAWLRLQFSRSQPLAAHQAEAQKVEAWLGKIADHVVTEWNEGDPLKKINNHYYWAAWAVMATSVVTDRRDLFDWSTKMYAIFSRQVDADGYLPNELARKTRAAGYQVYAVTPVAMLAAFGKANRLDLAAEGDDALQRAVGRAINAYSDPRPFEVKTGVRQTLEGVDEQRSKLAWLEAYCWTVQCNDEEATKLKSLRPMSNTRLGGDQTAVFGSG